MLLENKTHFFWKR